MTIVSGFGSLITAIITILQCNLMETCLTREKINVAGSLTEVKVKIGKWDVAYNYIEGELKHKITDSSAPEILLPTAFLVFQDGQNKKMLTQQRLIPRMVMVTSTWQPMMQTHLETNFFSCLPKKLV